MRKNKKTDAIMLQKTRKHDNTKKQEKQENRHDNAKKTR